MDANKLLELKNQIDNAKSEVQQLEGRKKYLFQELEENYGCKTIDQAKKKLQKLKKEIQTKQEKIDQQTAELKNKYNV